MRRILKVALGLVTGVSTLAMSGAVAHAATNQPIAATGGMESTINLLGVPLDVNVVLDTDTGDITSVEVLNAGQPADMTATKVTPTKVKFSSNTDGSTKVSVSARNNKLTLGVKTDSLSKLLGTNTWAANVMGTATDSGAAPGASTTAAAVATTGPKSSVTYTIGDAGDGTPTLTIDKIAPAAGVTAKQLDSWNGGKGGDDDEHASAGARIEFTQDGFRKVLSIWVSVDQDDDDSTGHASLHITLTGRNVQRKALADLAGDKTWTGKLCDGSAGSIAYAVSADGKVTINSTSPEGATVTDSRNGVMVKFATGDKVSIKVFTPDNGGDAALSINKSGRKCTGTRASVPDPTVNVSVATTTPDQAKTRRGDHKSDRKGEGKKND